MVQLHDELTKKIVTFHWVLWVGIRLHERIRVRILKIDAGINRALPSAVTLRIKNKKVSWPPSLSRLAVNTHPGPADDDVTVTPLMIKKARDRVNNCIML